MRRRKRKTAAGWECGELADVEIELMKQYLTRHACASERQPWAAAAQAMMEIGLLRAQERMERMKKHGLTGWICGTYTYQLRKAIEQALRAAYPEEELRSIAVCCAAGADGEKDRCERMLLQWHSFIPRICIHMRRLSLRDSDYVTAKKKIYGRAHQWMDIFAPLCYDEND